MDIVVVLHSIGPDTDSSCHEERNITIALSTDKQRARITMGSGRHVYVDKDELREAFNILLFIDNRG